MSSTANCPDCHGYKVRLTTSSQSEFVVAKPCSCVPKVCPTCKGDRFIIERDRFHRDIAKPCPDCVEWTHNLKLYNEAKVPKRYYKSQLLSKDRDQDNENIFTTLSTIPKIVKSGTRNEADMKGFVLMGLPGTGKTHLMAGMIFQCTIRAGISCRFQEFSQLISFIKQGFSEGKSERELIEPLLETTILVIDDLGKGRKTEWESGILDMLISERYNANKLLMVTTNYIETESMISKRQPSLAKESEMEEETIDTLRERIGMRVYSRLKEMCYFEELSGVDRRIMNLSGADRRIMNFR